MREDFKVFGLKAWAVTDNSLIYGNQEIPYSDLTSINLLTTPTTPLTNGVAQAVARSGKVYTLAFKHADKMRAHQVINFVKDKISESQGITKNYRYKLVSHTGSYLEVYDDYLILYFMPVGSVTASIARGGVTGGKRLNFSDITSIQFKEPVGVTAGFIQFAYAGSVENKAGMIAAANDENTILFGSDQLTLAREIVDYVEGARKKQGQSQQTTVIQQTSAADELKKFKELLDMGVITQEEFDAKKKQLLGL